VLYTEKRPHDGYLSSAHIYRLSPHQTDYRLKTRVALLELLDLRDFAVGNVGVPTCLVLVRTPCPVLESSRLDLSNCNHAPFFPDIYRTGRLGMSTRPVLEFSWLDLSNCTHAAVPRLTKPTKPTCNLVT
jgi:hypothetical protein